MGMLQAYSPNVLPMSDVPPFMLVIPEERPRRRDSATSRQLNPDRRIAPRAMGKDWVVVQQAIAGDTDAQEYLFARHTARLYQIAFGVLHNKEDAEDALQEALCHAYTNLRSFQGRSSFSTWLTRIVINSALMTLRRKGVHRESSLDEILDNPSERRPHRIVEARPDAEKICLAIEIEALLEHHVGRLPAAMRAAFQLGGMDGLSARESSQALGIPVSAFKSRLFRARRRLECGLQKSLERNANAPVTRRPSRRNGFPRNRGKMIESCW